MWLLQGILNQIQHLYFRSWFLKFILGICPWLIIVLKIKKCYQLYSHENFSISVSDKNFLRNWEYLHSASSIIRLRLRDLVILQIGLCLKDDSDWISYKEWSETVSALPDFCISWDCDWTLANFLLLISESNWFSPLLPIEMTFFKRRLILLLTLPGSLGSSAESKTTGSKNTSSSSLHFTSVSIFFLVFCFHLSTNDCRLGVSRFVSETNGKEKNRIFQKFTVNVVVHISKHVWTDILRVFFFFWLRGPHFFISHSKHRVIQKKHNTFPYIFSYILLIKKNGAIGIRKVVQFLYEGHSISNACFRG